MYTLCNCLLSFLQVSQIALINSPPDICKTKLEIALFVMVNCLAYSNSAINPVLYAFLSDNFKKSFIKACTCATGKDFNAQLQIENSIFRRFGKSKDFSAVPAKTVINQTPTAAVENQIENTATKIVILQEKAPVLHTDL